MLSNIFSDEVHRLFHEREKIVWHRVLEHHGMTQVNNYWDLDAMDKETTKAWSVLKRNKMSTQEMQQHHLNSIIAKDNYLPSRCNIAKKAQSLKRKQAATITPSQCNTHPHHTVTDHSIAASPPNTCSLCTPIALPVWGLRKKEIDEQRRMQQKNENRWNRIECKAYTKCQMWMKNARLTIQSMLT